MAISETQMYTRYSEWKILLQNHRHRNVFGELNDITFLALLWQHHPPIYLFVTLLSKNWKNGVNNTAWKVSKCRVISGPYFPVFGLNTRKYGPEITPYLDIFHAVYKIIEVYQYSSCFIETIIYKVKQFPSHSKVQIFLESCMEVHRRQSSKGNLKFLTSIY